MNHYTAFQPPHLAGKWQFAMLARRGGGPVCGCGPDDGHATRQAAERHAYDTSIAHAHAHQWDDVDVRRRCAHQGCDEWTNHRVHVRCWPYHFDEVLGMCTTHSALLFAGETRAAAIAELFPFKPGLESWGSL